MQLAPQQVTALQQTADRSLAANRVSIVVGLVLTPLLFGGIGGGLWAAIPAPFGMWVGGSLLAVGALLLCMPTEEVVAIDIGGRLITA